MTDDIAPSRRDVLAAGLAIGLTAACGTSGQTGAAGGSAGGTATATSGAVCVMTPEVTQGPYYLDNQLVRQDITEGKPGFPLALTLTVVDLTDGCAPVSNAPVEIWHCDAWGYYSGYTDKSPGGQVPAEDGTGDEKTFLRGVQVTDASGVATFTSIVPGWYSPRVTHIHVKVHQGGDIGRTYDGGTTVQTTQILFPDDVVGAYSGLDPYARHVLEPTKLADDQVYGEAERSGGDPKAMVPTLTLLTPSVVEDGYTLTMTLGVDPGATSKGGGGGAPP
ncbi:intradiol ring-cleavage dioxygenase [Nonomuraea soli]|uniref:Protocatechuate 3,4-dioxygenase beta subunit n=1 Tax=Nonomuraea soli TaxID=1032476 RepID=A0A7W0CDX8_9ACTN|nr:intradiol ring-cleavage dioxygenase [Nonomuraea soli]MBA2889366.1 protocatechuate 3,4-dioxygenase beta subunit [Nonomuraea soli]